MLSGTRRATDARHRTLRDLVAWSYDLLTPTEQRLFERVSMFADWFGLERAERTCGGNSIEVGDVAQLLSALVDKSMLVASSAAGATRYRLLETLRQFGRETLATRPEWRQVRDDHVAAQVALAEAAAIGLFGPDEARWTRELDDAFDDMREAHSAALAEGNVDAALRLVVALREYAWRHIRYELLAWTDATIAEPEAAHHPLFPVALAVAAYGRFVRGELDVAVEAGTYAIAKAMELGSSTLGLAERAAGNAEFYLGHADAAIAFSDRMVATAETLANPGLAAHAYYMRSVAETSVSNRERSATFAEMASVAATASGSPTALAQAAYANGIAVEKSDPDRALELFDESVRYADLVDNRWIRAFALTESLWIRATQGRPRAALGGYRHVIDTWFRGGDWSNQWLSLRYVFAILESLGYDASAATLFGALDGAGVMKALPIEPGNADEFAHAVQRLAARLDSETFAKNADRGRAMRDEEIVRFTLAELERIVSEGSDPEANRK